MYLGINLAGAEFGDNLPGEYGKDYIFPSKENIKYYADAGFRHIRLPFKWERVDQDMPRIKQFLDEANELEMKVVLDCHNYGRYKGFALAPDDKSLGEMWVKLAKEFKGHDAIWGYGIMNEPHDMDGWKQIAQTTVNMIREEDPDTRIYVCGNDWSGAHSWKEKNSDFILEGNNIIYEAHQYFDNDSSGRYDQDYAGEGAYPEVGKDRLRPFIEWLTSNNLRGAIGEFGNPPEKEWLVVMEWFAKEAIAGEMLEIYYWAGGPWWGDYKLSAENNSPQYQLMKTWIENANKPDPEPPIEPKPPVNNEPFKTMTWEETELKELEKKMDRWLRDNKDKVLVHQIHPMNTANKFGVMIVFKKL